MEQQMWFFGCDAACADGNLLVRYGFKRELSDQPRGRSSCYRFDWQVPGLPGTSAQVNLHGWSAGLHLRAPRAAATGFLYLRGGNRLGWYEALEPPAPGACDDDPAMRRSFHYLGCRPEAGFRRPAAWFFRWLVEYESWIEAHCGPRYRRRCHERAPLPGLPPAEGRDWLAAYGAALSGQPSGL